MANDNEAPCLEKATNPLHLLFGEFGPVKNTVKMFQMMVLIHINYIIDGLTGINCNQIQRTRCISCVNCCLKGIYFLQIVSFGQANYPDKSRVVRVGKPRSFELTKL